MSSSESDSAVLRLGTRRRRRRKKNVTQRTARRRINEDLDDLVGGLGCEGYSDGSDFILSVAVSDSEIEKFVSNLHTSRSPPPVNRPESAASVSHVVYGVSSQHSEHHPSVSEQQCAIVCEQQCASVSDQQCATDPELRLSDQCVGAGDSQEVPSEENEEWFECLDFGDLHYDCSVCVNCSCITCEECLHDPAGVNCTHCANCMSSEDYFDCSEGLENAKGDDSYHSDNDTDVIEDRSVVDEPENAMKKDLADICLQNNLTHSSINDILHFLRKYHFGHFPKDARTLLKIPLNIPIRVVSPGEYWHNGLTKVILDYVSKTKCSKVNVKLSYDSIPIAKSSGSSFSPISCMFNSCYDVYLIGVYHGYQKPDDPNDLLKDFIEEAIYLSENGLAFEDKVVGVKMHCLICDAPAKSFLLKVKGHSAYFGCTKCLVEGEYVDKRMSYLDMRAPLRTNESFCEQDNPAEEKTVFTKLRDFGCVSNVPLDYMHLVLLGVIRKIMYMWLAGPLWVRLPGRIVNQISQALLKMVPYTPKEFVRKPRSLQFIKTFKATEYRQILLYTGPVVFFGLLPRHIYEHFLTLHVAITLLVHPTFWKSLNSYAHELLQYFVKTFSTLYGSQFVSHNVHNLIHLCADSLKFGPLDTFSAFPFENFYQSLKKCVRKGEKPLQQLARRYQEMEKSRNNKVKRTEELTYKGLHTCGPLLTNCSNPQYSSCVLQNGLVLQASSEGDNCCVLSDESIILVKNFAFCREMNSMVVIGRKFSYVEDFYSVPCQSSLLGINKVSKLSDLKMWPVKNIIKKCFKLPFEDCFVVVPLLHSEKSQENIK